LKYRFKRDYRSKFAEREVIYQSYESSQQLIDLFTRGNTEYRFDWSRDTSLSRQLLKITNIEIFENPSKICHFWNKILMGCP